MKKPTLILFDLDGTLTNPQEGITRCVQHALNYFHIIVEDRDQLTPFIGPPLLDSFMQFYGLNEQEAKKAVEVYRERFSTVGLFENEVYDGIPEMLDVLKQSEYYLAVASSKPEIFVRRILDKFELSQYFDEIAGSELDGTRVDKEEVIEEVFVRMQKNHYDYGRVVMVGDRRFDIEGARKQNAVAVGVTYGFADEGELEQAGADYLAHTVKELEEYLISI
ncbi:MAG: HAD family hydrolase [Lachnospiraceae bacterium]